MAAEHAVAFDSRSDALKPLYAAADALLAEAGRLNAASGAPGRAGQIATAMQALVLHAPETFRPADAMNGAVTFVGWLLAAQPSDMRALIAARFAEAALASARSSAAIDAATRTAAEGHA